MEQTNVGLQIANLFTQPLLLYRPYTHRIRAIFSWTEVQVLCIELSSAVRDFAC